MTDNGRVVTEVGFIVRAMLATVLIAACSSGDGIEIGPQPQRMQWVGQHLAQDRHEVAVGLDRCHRGSGLGESERQRSEPGADLDHRRVGTDPGQAGDAAHGVGVDHEVLPEGPARGQAVLVEQIPHLAGAQRHRR